MKVYIGHLGAKIPCMVAVGRHVFTTCLLIACAVGLLGVPFFELPSAVAKPLVVVVATGLLLLAFAVVLALYPLDLRIPRAVLYLAIPFLFACLASYMHFGLLHQNHWMELLFGTQWQIGSFGSSVLMVTYALGAAIALSAIEHMSPVRWKYLVYAACTCLFALSVVLVFRAEPPIRPSLALDTLIAGSVVSHDATDAMFGIGPMRYDIAWTRHRPLALNETFRWNTTEVEGYSSLSTLFVTHGIAGLLSLILPFILVSGFVFRRPVSVLALIAYTGALASFALLLFRNNDVSTLILYATACVAVIHFVSAEKSFIVVAKHVSSVACLALSALFLFTSADQLQAALYAQRAAEAPHEESVRLYSSSTTFWSAPQYQFALAQAHVVLANEKSAAGASPLDDIQAARNIADNLAAMHNYDYALFRSHLYLSLVELGFPNTQSILKESIETLRSSPARPEYWYLRALYDAKFEGGSHALVLLKHALTLKPNYQDALLLQEALAAQGPQDF